MREVWTESPSVSFNSSSSRASKVKKGGRAWQLIRKGRILGLSKILLKSFIFAIAGILATLVFKLINKRKAMMLAAMEEEERQQERDLLQSEWDRIEESKQPLL